jgi:hypothetical protein
MADEKSIDANLNELEGASVECSLNAYQSCCPYDGRNDKSKHSETGKQKD